MDKNRTEQRLETLRRRARLWHMVTLALSGAALVLFFWFLYHMEPDPGDSAAMHLTKSVVVAGALALGAFALLWLLLGSRPYRKFNEMFRDTYVLALLRTLPWLEGLGYDKRKGFSWDTIRRAGVVNCGEAKYFHSEDSLSGWCEDMPFYLSNVTTRRVIRLNRKVRVEDIFDGLILSLKGFDGWNGAPGHVQIFQKEFLSDLRGWTAPHKIKTEDASFNSRYLVYASDEACALRLLTPRRLEQIMAYTDQVGGQVAITYQGDLVFIAVSRERGLFHAVVDVPVEQQKETLLQDAEKVLRQSRRLLQ